MIRKNKGITQRELADSMGVSFQYISQLEKEDKELTGLSINTLQKCATALGCTPHDLTADTQSESKTDLMKKAFFNLVTELHAAGIDIKKVTIDGVTIENEKMYNLRKGISV